MGNIVMLPHLYHKIEEMFSIYMIRKEMKNIGRN